jgi:hypothetical protein
MLRQPNTDISKPPSTGPAAIETPPAAVHQAMALASMARSSAYTALRMDSELGTSRPRRCLAARATLSSSASGATAQASEASVNRAKPPRNTLREPKRSPIAPADSRTRQSPACRRRPPIAAGSRPLAARGRSPAGATLTMVTSSWTMMKAKLQASRMASEGEVFMMRLLDSILPL